MLVQRGSYQVPAWVSASARDLIGQMLQVEPRRRIRVQAILSHAWTVRDQPAAPLDSVTNSFQALTPFSCYFMVLRCSVTIKYNS